MLRKIPLGLLCLSAGGVITVVGFAAYLLNYAALNMIGFFYGIPLFLGGIALKITELKPIPLTKPTTTEVAALKQRQATATQTQIFNDVTRYRYGQEAHLDSSLRALGLSPIDDERPVLVGIRETIVEGAYAMILEFDSPFMPFSTWQSKQAKMTTFFGPGVRVEVANPEQDYVDMSIIATPAGTDRTVDQTPDPAIAS